MKEILVKLYLNKYLFAMVAMLSVLFWSNPAFATDQVVAQAQSVSTQTDVMKQVVMTEDEVRALITDKSVSYDGKEYGVCKQNFKADGTFTFLCNDFHDSGKWYFKDHANEPRRMLCRDYQQQGSNCSSMAKNNKEEYFFGLSLKSQKKVLRTESLNPS